MKKILAMILAAALTATMTGCVSRGESSSSSEILSSSSAVTSQPDKVTTDTPVAKEEEFVPVSPNMATDFDRVAAMSPKPITWGFGLRRDEKNRAADCIGLQEKYGKYNMNFIGADEQKVYLTFDEGYENGYTAPILDVLKEKDVKAVFFVTGHYVKSNPELVRRMIDEGHFVGNHSWGHIDYSKSTPQVMYDDLKKLHDYVQKEFDYTMHLFRYPEGTFSEQSMGVLQMAGYQSVSWSFGYNDWDQKNQPDKQLAHDKIVGAAAPGTIYLLHAVSSTNAEILGQAIDDIRGKGFEFSEYDIVPAQLADGVGSVVPNVPVEAESSKESDKAAETSSADSSSSESSSAESSSAESSSSASSAKQ